MKFYPDYVCDSVLDITPPWLGNIGIKGLALDLDNTLATYAEREFSPRIADWLNALRKSGLRLVVVTNNRKERAEGFCVPLGIPFVNSARKPFKSGLIKAAGVLGVCPGSIALVGDQVFTDALGASRCGMISIVVKPLRLNNFFLRLRNRAEQPFLRKGQRIVNEQR